MSRESWHVPAEREPGVLYMHGQPGTDYASVTAIEVDGQRFERVRTCELWRGTCRIEYRGMGYYCSECGAMVGSDDVTSELHIDANAIELWCFCPRCGSVVSADD